MTNYSGPPTKIMMSMRIRPDLHAAVKARAQVEHRHVTNMIEELLVLGLQQPPTPPPTFYTGEK